MIETGIEPTYTTALGQCIEGDALDVLRKLPSNSVSLVMTSPPFALRRRKAYGNVEASEYVEWFWPFAGGDPSRAATTTAVSSSSWAAPGTAAAARARSFSMN